MIPVRARKQAELRKRLLMIDPQCAITGERFPILLEAAHVVSKANDGADIETNAILLRADLHRLFDGGAFRIRKNGAIIIKRRDLPSEYLNLLHGKSIPHEIFSRIKDALKIDSALKLAKK